MLQKPAIVSVGAGNLATQLIREFHANGYPILSVYSRTLAAARELAESTGSVYTNNLTDLPETAGIYIISISDNAIPFAIKALAGTGSIVVHTAGSVGIEVFEREILRYGVIYPLQTFSKSRKVNFQDIPFLIEASDVHTMNFLKDLISDISGNIIEMSSEKRKWLHTAAVIACNFTNHMFASAYDLLSSKNLEFNLLYPIITETLNKAMEGNPGQVQTGPAVRGDMNVVNEHLKMLKAYPDLQEIYTFISRKIIEYHSNKKKNNE